MVVNNPALTVMPDGRILMIYKGVQDTPGGDTSKPNGVVKIGAAIAESPMGPFEKQDGLLFEGSGTLAAEDPFIWYSSEERKCMLNLVRFIFYHWVLQKQLLHQ